VRNHGRRAGTNSTGITAGGSASRAKSDVQEPGRRQELAGAALTSFMKKCQTDATASCNTVAADKKLVGAAKSSFTKKCLADAVGT
jgi:hypothetical protein